MLPIDQGVCTLNRLHPAPAPRPVRVLAVASGKGGVGKTNVAVNLSLALAGLGRRTVLLDADLGLANVDILLGLRPARNLSHVIEGECALAEILVDGPGGLRIIPASSGIQRMADLAAPERAGLVHAFSALADDIDVLVVDTAAGIAGAVLGFCSAAQEVLVVVCNDPASITDAYALIKVLHQDHGRQRFRILVNKAQTPQEGLVLFQRLQDVTGQFLDVTLDLVATIPLDPGLRRAVQRQRALLDLYPDSPAARAFKDLARRSDNWSVPASASGRLEFFFERMVGLAPARQVTA